MKTGRILGIVGGLLAIVGVFLPWATATNPISGTTVSASGLDVPIFGLLTLLFGVLGLLLVTIGKKGTCTGGVVMGILAFVMALIVYAVWAAIFTSFGVGSIFSFGYGLYVSLAGSLILVIGSIMARKEATLPLPQVPPAGMAQQPTELN